MADDRLLLARNSAPAGCPPRTSPEEAVGLGLRSKPRFIKAEIAIDPIMSKRRSPVLTKGRIRRTSVRAVGQEMWCWSPRKTITLPNL